ncbi:TolC family protein [Robiginitalea sp. SC105]|uniref:TolC family protein n=1 Tax=Robiginitalea sp. SC105 TaxID=2762332 RepID=UPI00163A1A9A|nr:TolC family protein [Robiginitalea sp. SC105]MBC2838824.1 TolC family protein [Robiginitalea sp. SC105]
METSSTNNSSIRVLAILAMALALVYSCVPARDVREANTDLPARYSGLEGDTLNAAAVSWKEYFRDPRLQELIDSALVRNQELNIMLRQVEMAQNEIRARKGEYLPFVNLQAGAEVEKAARYTRNGALEATTDIREGEEFPEPLTNYSVGAFASWELDVWKKLRNSKKAAVFEYLASAEGRKFMVTRLVSEIADTYYELMALDNQLDIIEKNLEIQENALRIVKLQKQAARVTELAVRRFEAEVLKNQSHKFEISQQITEAENRLNFLVGRTPRQVSRNSETFIEKAIDTPAAGIPSQLLLYRPDIRRAEFELEAAKLDVRAARANFFPSIGLRAGVGLEAFKPRFLTSTPESVLYSVVGDAIAPLINRNAIKAEYFNASARQEQAVFEYEKAILNAYIEVANQLSNQRNLQNSYALKEGQVAALNESIEIAGRLFQSARADYWEVLLTQRDALEARMELVETKKDQLLARVALYRALGGGWN